jgi:hypothetical protein
MAILTITPAASQPIGVTSWDSLASGNWATAAQIANSSQYVDMLIGGTVVSGAGTANATFNIYAAATHSDTASDIGGAIGGLIPLTSVAVTDGTEFISENLILLAVVSIGAAPAARTLHWGPVSIAAAYGGVMPNNISLLLHNDSGATSGAGATADYIGIQYTST